MPTLDPIEVAWAAGFIEGEGTFGNSGRGLKHFRVSTSQTATREPLERLQKLFGGSILPISQEASRRRGVNARDNFMWIVSGEEASKCVGAIFNHLSERRREQAINILAQAINNIGLRYASFSK